jgi:hypothetical protein
MVEEVEVIDKEASVISEITLASLLRAEVWAINGGV